MTCEANKRSFVASFPRHRRRRACRSRYPSAPAAQPPPHLEALLNTALTPPCAIRRRRTRVLAPIPSVLPSPLVLPRSRRAVTKPAFSSAPAAPTSVSFPPAAVLLLDSGGPVPPLPISSAGYALPFHRASTTWMRASPSPSPRLPIQSATALDACRRLAPLLRARNASPSPTRPSPRCVPPRRRVPQTMGFWVVAVRRLTCRRVVCALAGSRLSRSLARRRRFARRASYGPRWLEASGF
ncbi:hypothetical protein C8J57DRAFT_1715942 [Mycena rebaudengoi]|nr:hypothetical protein C8J57DRAFT_1715942 [Mycena rebaudengoi]